MAKLNGKQIDDLSNAINEYQAALKKCKNSAEAKAASLKFLKALQEVYNFVYTVEIDYQKLIGAIAGQDEYADEICNSLGGPAVKEAVKIRDALKAVADADLLYSHLTSLNCYVQRWIRTDFENARTWVNSVKDRLNSLEDTGDRDNLKKVLGEIENYKAESEKGSWFEDLMSPEQFARSRNIIAAALETKFEDRLNKAYHAWYDTCNLNSGWGKNYRVEFRNAVNKIPNSDELDAALETKNGYKMFVNGLRDQLDQAFSRLSTRRGDCMVSAASVKDWLNDARDVAKEECQKLWAGLQRDLHSACGDLDAAVDSAANKINLATLEIVLQESVRLFEADSPALAGMLEALKKVLEERKVKELLNQQ